jgi:hypothetical protein
MKSALEIFNVILDEVKQKRLFMLNDDFSALDSDGIAGKALYRATDEALKKSLSEENYRNRNKLFEGQEFITLLKEKVKDGEIDNDKLEEIIQLKEFKEYTNSCLNDDEVNK